MHFALHGCGAAANGLAEYTGYNQMGALNNIIMVYPDTKCWALAPNTLDDPVELGNTNRGVIPSAFKSMIERVVGEPVVSLTEWLDD